MILNKRAFRYIVGKGENGAKQAFSLLHNIFFRIKDINNLLNYI